VATKNVFFIDARVQDRLKLIQDLPTDSLWFVLDDARDGVDQMRQALQNFSGLDSIQVISHGASGELWLGNSVVDVHTLLAYKSQLGEIGASLGSAGDLLLYGCEVAQGRKGKEFMDTLSLMTGADVAASTDATGAAALGGNWVLERATGRIESKALARPGFNMLLGDAIAPNVTTFSPADEATAVAIGANIVLTFSEAVQRGIGNIILKTDAGVVVATYDVATSANLSLSGSTLTIDPTADLGYNTGYKVEFAAGTIKDFAGNNAAGITEYNLTTNNRSVSKVALSEFIGASLCVQDDGRIVQVGSVFQNGRSNIALVRFNSDGSRDESFSGSNTQTNNSETNYLGSTVQLTKDGRLLVSGYSENNINHISGPCLFQFNSDGSLDKSFSNGGPSDLKHFGVASNITILNDGKILQCGSYSDVEMIYGTGQFMPWKFGIDSYNADGSKDINFGESGRVTTGINLARGQDQVKDHVQNPTPITSIEARKLRALTV
jgi:uncharacterized delta-60 repeat protein